MPPVDVNVGGAVIQLTTGELFTCALLDLGGVRCWGDSSQGRLGYANADVIGDNEAPTVAGDVSLGAPAEQITTGNSHSCALLDDGSVRCWGSGNGGALGYGIIPGVLDVTDAGNGNDNIGDNELPSTVGPVNFGAGTVAQITAGGLHTCVRLTTGDVRCWGDSGFGQLGYANETVIGDNETPAAAYGNLPNSGNVNIGGVAIDIQAGFFHTCVLLDTNAVRCWGVGEAGVLGYVSTNDIGDNEAPASAGDVNIGGDVVQIAVGDNHACALLDTGNIRCWGRGAGGPLGYGNNNNVGDTETPASRGDVLIFE
jgi:alpha-tubulin suppressor-like RCC1 family protein